VSVSADDVRRVAQLARLGIDAGRVPALVEELNGILAHMDVLQRVDLTAASTEAGVAAAAPWRDDVVAPVPLARPRDAVAPSMRDGFFLVPRLATHDAAGASASGDAAG
jgi:aspartyl-tRNA(Asn)/glutamyl-tRNA(Gln) amidotransferase subunit C